MAARHMAGTVAAALLLAATAQAATVTYDFNSGIGTDFEVVNNQNKFTIGTNGTIHISKGADSPPGANEFIGGGIRANFALGGISPPRSTCCSPTCRAPAARTC